MTNDKLVGEVLKVARSLIALNKYLEHSEGFVTFLGQGKSVKYHIVPQGDKYIVYEFNGERSIAKKLADLLDVNNLYRNEAKIDDLLANSGTLYRYSVNEDIVNDVEYNNRGKYWEKRIAYSVVYDAYIQSRKGMKIIDLGSDLANQLGIKKTSKMTKKELYKLIVKKEKLPVGEFERIFGGGISEEEEDDVAYKHKTWDVRVEEGAKVDVEDVNKFLDNVKSALSKKGKGDLAYGRVYIVRSLQSNVLADYEPNADIMRVRAKGFDGSSRDMLKSAIHELGHRNWYRKFSKEGRNEVKIKYRFYGSRTPLSEDLGLEVGDILNDKEVERFKVIDVRYEKVLAEMIETKNSRRNKNIGKNFGIPASSIATNDWEIEGKVKPNMDFNSYFPTAYSKTSYEEMYAELFAFWVENKLTEPAKSWFDGLH